MGTKYLSDGRLLLVAALAAVACAGEAAPGAVSGAPAAAAGAAQTADIRHVEPRPDSVGPQPTRFVWSATDRADSYTLRVWNEADVRVVQEAGLTQTEIEFPREYDLPPGTYFWAVVGMRGSQPVAESGLAAFVVQKP